MSDKKLLLGNEAIAYGLLMAGCTMMTSYPGTPASEILTTVSKLKNTFGLNIHVEWSVNEKVAFETALANSYAEKRSVVAMKQVGLNVAMDPLMSAAYTGVKGGFVAVVADDPGPHSSQTEQDTRFFSMAAKVPVLDPISPRDTIELIKKAFELSEVYEIPVIFRPTTRVCHARQDVPVPDVLEIPESEAHFDKDPTRWAATPKFRLLLHEKLNEKMEKISGLKKYSPFGLNPECSKMDDACIVGSGVVLTYAWEIMEDMKLLDKIPLFRVPMPYPLNREFSESIIREYKKILVLEESYPVIEYQLEDREKVYGRLNGFVPPQGELVPEVVEDILGRFLDSGDTSKTRIATAPPRRPTLCPGCPHRASFFALRKVFPNGIYPSDIGCYTLGLNLAAVDTVLCMGAGVSHAAGFYHAFRQNKSEEAPIMVATIGDSTFFHSGITALINAVIQGARFVLIILDNGTTAMTGNQPTPASGINASGQRCRKSISMAKMVEACGIDFIREGDPYDLKAFIEILKEAKKYVEEPEGGIAVVISNHPCLMNKDYQRTIGLVKPRVTDRCKSCHYCIEHFECPALVEVPGEDRITIDYSICSGCGVCVSVCPRKAIVV